MSNQNENINNFYRSQFEKFQKDPPEHIWENIKKTLNSDPAIVKIKPGNKGYITGFTTILIIVLLISSYLFYRSHTGNNSETHSPVNQFLSPKETVTPAADTLLTEAEEDIELVFSETRGINATSRMAKPSKTKKASAIHSMPSDPADQKLASDKVARTSLLVEEFREDIRTNQISLLQKQKAGFITRNGNPETPESYTLSKPQLVEGDDRSSPKIREFRNRGQLWLGIFFTPEIIYHHEGNVRNNRGRSIDLQVLYEKNNVILQTGLGVSQIKDAGHHKIEFNKYLGSYEHVNNVIFDSVGNDLVVTYITETVYVYDTINYIRISPADRHFTYLQLPFLIGYYKEINRFKWYVKTGPSFSFKIHEQIPAAPMTDDQYKILNIDNDLPEKINTHWQLLFSAGTSYRLGNKVSLSVEPLFKYYINSDYARNTMSGRHPYSFGLKTGLLLDL
jgi:hypothetical protein